VTRWLNYRRWWSERYYW